MEGRSKASCKYLLLQVWCGLLTVAMVVMAAFLASIKPKSDEDGAPTWKTMNFTPTGAPLNSLGSSFSYIQLMKISDKQPWEESLPKCESCSLVLRNDSVHCMSDGLYIIYAQVTFSKESQTNRTKLVILTRGATFGKKRKKLVEGTYPATSEGSVWVAKIVSLQEGDSVSLTISDSYHMEETFWGAYQIH